MKIFLILLLGLWSPSLLAHVTIAGCQERWLSTARFEKLLAVELVQRPEVDPDQLQISVTDCKGDQVTLNIIYMDRSRQTAIPLRDISPENRLRTLVLACAEMFTELEHTPPPPGNQPPLANATMLVRPVASTGELPTNQPLIGMSDVPIEPAADHTKQIPKKAKPAAMKTTPTVASTPVSRQPPAAAQNDVSDDTLSLPPATGSKQTVHFGITVHGIVFPAQGTIAPQLRLAFQLNRLLLGTHFYGRRWRDSLGTVYAVAPLGFAGARLWEYRGKVILGWDILAELGAVISKSRASGNALDAQKSHFAFGGQSELWLRTLNQGTQFVTTISAGWLRGLNAFAANRKLGGFHGVMLSAGLGIIW
ncbi:MAG: hypothetical protein JXX14_19350 [Deltaproteobacteria bacterium]|nr:hypothetical protein [Deltaproteobacteria bacterium]